MFFDFGLKSSTLLFFFLHGILFTILLVYKGLRNEQKANYWLAGFVFLAALYISPFMCGYANWYSNDITSDILFYLPLQQLFFMPPLLYFYVRYILNKSYTFQKRDFYHFLPALLYLGYAFIMWFTDKIVLNEYYFYANGRDKDLDLWYQVVGFFFMVFYVSKCLQLYNQYRKNTVETVSFADSILFSWIQRFLIALLLLLFIRMLFFITNPEWANFGRKFWYYLTFSILVYYISLNGYTYSIKMTSSLHRKLNFNQPLDELFQLDLGDRAETMLEENNKVEEKEVLTVQLDEELKKLVLESMEKEKLFQNPDLTLFDLANTLNTHPKKVSQTINNGFGVNFNDFVNGYRIKEVIRIIEEGKGELKTIVGVAYDAGFNSKSTFNRAFKKMKNTTPKSYFNSLI
ncbi:MAG: helix-turn-helix domain-containing protein [Saprospiraceae bacterium]|nr:helix-turn-helix domain-containing protein [Saprospiraceae bacterium]